MYSESEMLAGMDVTIILCGRNRQSARLTFTLIWTESTDIVAVTAAKPEWSHCPVTTAHYFTVETQEAKQGSNLPNGNIISL